VATNEPESNPSQNSNLKHHQQCGKTSHELA
jgi:hypothetical protein